MSEHTVTVGVFAQTECHGLDAPQSSSSFDKTSCLTCSMMFATRDDQVTVSWLLLSVYVCILSMLYGLQYCKKLVHCILRPDIKRPSLGFLMLHVSFWFTGVCLVLLYALRFSFFGTNLSSCLERMK